MRGLHYIATPALDKAAPWWLPPPLTVLHLWSLYPISQIYFSDSLIQDINFKIPKQVHRSIIAWTHEINLPGDVEWQPVMVYKTWRSWLKRWSQHAFTVWSQCVCWSTQYQFESSVECSSLCANYMSDNRFLPPSPQEQASVSATPLCTRIIICQGQLDPPQLWQWSI